MNMTLFIGIIMVACYVLIEIEDLEMRMKG